VAAPLVLPLLNSTRKGKRAGAQGNASAHLCWNSVSGFSYWLASERASTGAGGSARVAHTAQASSRQPAQRQTLGSFLTQLCVAQQAGWRAQLAEQSTEWTIEGGRERERERDIHTASGPDSEPEREETSELCLRPKQRHSG